MMSSCQIAAEGDSEDEPVCVFFLWCVCACVRGFKWCTKADLTHTVYTNTQHGVKTNKKLKSWIVLLQEYIIFIFIYIYIHIYIHTYINIYIYSLDFLHCMKFTGMHEFMHCMTFFLPFFLIFFVIFCHPSSIGFLKSGVMWVVWSYVRVMLTSTDGH